MDRRQKKTREAIFTALGRLLEQKHFNSITVQEIIDEADIGRSTFYAHFETKDMLLKAMCTDIFEHIFSDHLSSEQSHDFSGKEISNREKITHLLYHIKDDGHEIRRILSGESSELFMRYFKEYLRDMFARYINRNTGDVPEDFLLNHLVGSFAEAILWWIRNKMKESPETIADYFLTVTINGFQNILD